MGAGSGMMTEPYQARVYEERSQLAERWTKLTRFLETATFSELVIDEQRRMIQQQHIMSIYLQILNARIKAFE
jgi:hypothetical protein